MTTIDRALTIVLKMASFAFIAVLYIANPLYLSKPVSTFYLFSVQKITLVGVMGRHTDNHSCTSIVIERLVYCMSEVAYTVITKTIL